MCRTRSAFTLVEVLMVVVIIGIAAAVVVPQMSTRDDLKAIAAGRAVMSDLIYAQNMAITCQIHHYLVFNTTTQSYSVVSSADMATPITNPVNQSPYTVQFGNTGSGGLRNMSIDSANFQGSNATVYSTIGFDELGTPVVYTGSGADQPISTGAIAVRSGNYKLQITIQPYTGQLSAAQVPYP
ncbi:MAG: Tfp pilus assembly protein FimT/FimU [Tepidisphaerales bacterium]